MARHNAWQLLTHVPGLLHSHDVESGEWILGDDCSSFKIGRRHHSYHPRTASPSIHPLGGLPVRASTILKDPGETVMPSLMGSRARKYLSPCLNAATDVSYDSA
jgi:hypothetical protein